MKHSHRRSIAVISAILSVSMLMQVTPCILWKTSDNFSVSLHTQATEVKAFQQVEYKGHAFNKKTGNSIEKVDMGFNACSIFSLMNAVYYKTGNTLNPDDMASFATNGGYRPIGSQGVQGGFWRAYCEKEGEANGFYYRTSCSPSKALAYVREGDTVIWNIPTHYIAVVDYDASKNKYLILDSASDPSRFGGTGTNTYKKVNAILEANKNGSVECEIKDGKWTGAAWVPENFLNKATNNAKDWGYLSGSTAYVISYQKSKVNPPMISHSLNWVNDNTKTEDLTDPFNYPYPQGNVFRLKSNYQRGAGVAFIQASLTYLGYSCTVDSVFGPATEKQVRMFQEAHRNDSYHLSVDGIAGRNTLNALYQEINNKKNNIAAAEAQPSYTEPSTNEILKLTTPLMKGIGVKWLQTALNKLSNANLVVDGYFGKKTNEALKKFQSQQQMFLCDGILGSVTRGLINSLLSKQEKGEYCAPQSSASDIAKNGYRVPDKILRYGSKGDEVRWLQGVLNIVNLSGLDIDGCYGNMTQKAVKDFQAKHGLDSDGVYGPKTKAALEKEWAAISSSVTVCAMAAPSISELSFISDRNYYGSNENITFQFDTDSGEKYRLVITNESGNVVYDYVTEEITASVFLEPDYYTAKLIVSNDKGELESNLLDFVVFEQSIVCDGTVELVSDFYEKAISWNMDSVGSSTADESEKLWYIISEEDATFRLMSIRHNGYALTVENGILTASQNAYDENALWYLYEENGMTFIKNKISDLALTISSDGTVSAEKLDTSSYAQSICLQRPDRTMIRPQKEFLDASHLQLSWNKVEGAEDYTVYVLDNSVETDDNLFSFCTVSDTSCQIEIPAHDNYDILLEANAFNGTIIVNMSVDENEISVEEIPEETEDMTSKKEYYLTLISQLQNYLLHKTDYSPKMINELDMNYDQILNIYDLILLKKLAIDETT